MKRFALAATLSLIMLGSAPAVEAPNAHEQEILAAIKEVQAQQALIADNQSKIDERLATVAEAIRVARLYSSRSGH